MATNPNDILSENITNQQSSGRIRPYSTQDIQGNASTRFRPYESPEFEGSATAEGFKSGLRGISTILPKLGKAGKQFQQNTEETAEDTSTSQKLKKFASNTIKFFPGIQSFVNSSAAVYDMKPEYFGRSHADVKRDEGTPIPESVQKSLPYRAGEFLGMDAPFIAADIATGGASAVFRHGLMGAAKLGAKNLAQKGAFGRATNVALGVTAKPILAAEAAKTLEDAGLPAWASNLIGVPAGYWAIPKAFDKAGRYVLEKATESILKSQSKTAAQGITPTFANSSTGTMSEIALGILQKDSATRNVIKGFVAKQDKEFGDSLLTILGENNSIINEAEDFLTDVLETKTSELSEAEEFLSQQEEQLGNEAQSLEEQSKSIQTGLDEQQEATTQIIEESISPVKPDIQKQTQEITEEAAQSLPETPVNVSDNLIQRASDSIKGLAKSEADQQAAELVDNIPIYRDSNYRAVDTIYESISPRIGQPEAGQIYKDLRDEAYKIANTEKRKMYGELQKAAENSTYNIPPVQFRSLTNQLQKIISSLESLPFRSPTQEKAFNRLTELNSSFDTPGSFVSMDDGIEPMQDIPSILKLWEARKSFGQSINWKSSLPGEKILKEEYAKFNNALQRQMKQAGLYELYESANQNYIDRFLPLEQGTNGRIKYMNPDEAGKILNLQAISSLENFIPLDKLNPIRRHALERVVGRPSQGEAIYRQAQKLMNVNRYLTPNEQAQFVALQEMPLMQARVAISQLGKIEVFLEKNRQNLSKEIITQLEKIASELRSRADLPVKYITGRAQLDDLQKAADAEFEVLKGDQNKNIISLKRELRQSKAEGKAKIQDISEKKQEISEQSKAISGQKKDIKKQQARLQKSLLYSMLQKDTNRDILNEMSSVEGIREIKSLLGDSPNAKKILEGLKQQKARKIFENALSIHLVVKLLRNESSRTLLRELLTTPQFDKLEKLVDLAKNFQERMRYFVNQSNTAVQQGHLRELSDLIIGVTSNLLMSSAIGVLGVVGKFVIKQKTKEKIAKIFTDPNAMQGLIDFAIKMKRDPSSKETIASGNKLIRFLVKAGYIAQDEAEINQEEKE